MRWQLFAAVLLAWLAAPAAAQYSIATVAGDLADGTLATETRIFPVALASGRNGTLYIATPRRILALSPDGRLETVVGTGLRSGPREGPARSVQVGTPSALAFDPATDSLYLAEGGEVRRRDAAGNVTLVAAQAPFQEIRGLAVDGQGSLYLADWAAHRVWHVNASGAVSVAAGTGAVGFSGDGGPAAEALLNQPSAVALDTAGELFIADSGNQRIRNVLASGAIRSAAEIRAEALAADTAGNIFFTGTNCLCLLAPSGAVEILAAPGSQQGAAADAFGVYFFTADGRVWRWDAATRQSQLIAGGGAGGDGGSARSAQVLMPWGVAVDAQDNVFFTDVLSQAIRRIDASGAITPVMNATPLTRLALDPAGNLYFTSGNSVLRQGRSGGAVTRIAGGGPNGIAQEFAAADGATLETPGALAVAPNGDVFFSQRAQVFRVSSGQILLVAGGAASGSTGDGGPARNALLNQVQDLAVDGAGNLFISLGDSIRRVDAASGIITTVAAALSSGAMAVAPNGNLFAADGSAVRWIDTATGVSYPVAGGGPDPGPLGRPTGLAVDQQGRVWVADAANAAIYVLSPPPPNSGRRR